MLKFPTLSLYQCIAFSLTLTAVHAQNIPRNDQNSMCVSVSHQLDNLKLSTENLRLRLDISYEQQQSHYNELASKLKNLDEKFERLLEQVATKADAADNIDVLERGPKLSDLRNQLKEDAKRFKKADEITHSLLRNLTETVFNKTCRVAATGALLGDPDLPYPTSCNTNDTTYCSAGKCLIWNKLLGEEPFNVSCDNISDGGGWLVIQRRHNGSVDFYQDWQAYKKGFGHIDGEFWLGLDKIHALTTTLTPVELLIQMESHNNITKYAKYKNFTISNEKELYKIIEISGYEGDAGDSFSSNKGHKFTTKDKDSDTCRGNCATHRKGGWWFHCCSTANLNGLYYEANIIPEFKDGIYWHSFHQSYFRLLKFVQMMIRPRKNETDDDC